MTIAAGSGLPCESTVTFAFEVVISVVVRLVSPPEPPGRNSTTLPRTLTASPTTTLGALLVKTKSASDVRSSASELGSCR
jgi:hypothetical protein